MKKYIVVQTCSTGERYIYCGSAKFSNRPQPVFESEETLKKSNNAIHIHQFNTKGNARARINSLVKNQCYREEWLSIEEVERTLV